jgi:hypothetical protein
MTRTEHLLSCLSEECAEVAQRVSKALRFGLTEIQPGQELTNAERIVLELADLSAVIELLEEAGALKRPGNIRTLIEEKKAKIEKFFELSRRLGTLTDEQQ